MSSLARSIAVAAALGTCPAAMADTFDFETGLSFLRSDRSTTFRSTFAPLPSFTSRTDSEDDLTALTGTWFFSGVSINEGPRTRAAFLSRASSVTAEFADIDAALRVRTTFDDPMMPDQTLRESVSGDAWSIGGRYVSQSSGWYGLGRVTSSGVDNGGDAESYRLGVGKYVAERTSVDLTISYDDLDFTNTTTVALGLTHVGDLSSTWQYGADVTISRPDFSGAEVLMDAAFSLYPSRSVAFGVQYLGSLEDLGGGARYDAFASWFVNESVEISARLGTTDVDDAAFANTDDDRWGIGFRLRF